MTADVGPRAANKTIVAAATDEEVVLALAKQFVCISPAGQQIASTASLGNVAAGATSQFIRLPPTEEPIVPPTTIENHVRASGARAETATRSEHVVPSRARHAYELRRRGEHVGVRIPIEVKTVGPTVPTW